jgi:dipeptidyl-peptidase-4
MFDRLTAALAALSGIGLFGLAACQPADTAVPTEPALSIERALGSPSLNGPSPRSLRFSPDGTRVTFLRAKDEDRTVLDLWAMDIDGGAPYMLVDSQVLAPDERALTEAERQLRERARISSSGIVRYQWDSQGEAVLVPLDGDVFHVDVASGDARRVMQTPEYETNARVSPQGNFVSFIREQNLYVTHLETGDERAITTEGGDLISWGTAEFVAQEEFDRYTGYWWSPDERFIALARVDETRVDNIERLEIGSDGSANVVDQRYPRAGTENAVVELFLFDMESGEMRPVELAPTDDFYLARVNWARDSGTAYVQVLNRVQNALDIRAVNAATGASSTWLEETTNIWINLTNDFRALSDGSVIWTSEDTPGGFRHIQHRAADGSLITQVTSGEWVVTSLSAIDSENGLVYFTGWMETPIERHLYVVPLDGSAEPTPITQGHGRWGGTFNRGATAFIGSYSDPATPPQTGLYSSDGSQIRWIEENRLDETHPYGEFADVHVVPSYGTLEAADGSILHYTLYKPVDFVPGRQYPAVQYLYGGPHVQVVTRGWQGTRAQLFAQRGYVYFTLDNRGSYYRGREFEGHIQRAMGSVEVEDQLVGLDFLQSLEFVDADNIGMWGWSYGGYMTLMTTLQAPGRYAAGVSGAPVTDWTLYDTAYTERYMDHPDANFEGYQQSSVFAHLDGYETPLLLVHGMADDNVIFANSVRLYAELQEQGSQFEMMTYPGQRHGVRGEARQIHLWTGIFDFFDRHLKDDDEG